MAKVQSGAANTHHRGGTDVRDGSPSHRRRQIMTTETNEKREETELYRERELDTRKQQVILGTIAMVLTNYGLCLMKSL